MHASIAISACLLTVATLKYKLLLSKTLLNYQYFNDRKFNHINLINNIKFELSI